MTAISSLSAQEKAKASSLPVAAGPAAIAAVTAAQAAVENEHERAMAVVRVMPWAVAFLARTKHFRGLLDKERLDIQGGDEASGGWRSRGTGISVRRELLLEDGLRALESLARGGSAALRDRVMVKFINAFGVEEVGIDVGGVFKDFWGDLTARAFSLSYGLFTATADGRLYPNPAASSLFDRHELEVRSSSQPNYIYISPFLAIYLFTCLSLRHLCVPFLIIVSYFSFLIFTWTIFLTTYAPMYLSEDPAQISHDISFSITRQMPTLIVESLIANPIDLFFSFRTHTSC
jgi:hypothetical protein